MRTATTRGTRLVLALAALPLLAAACGGSGDDEAGSSPGTEASVSPTSSAAAGDAADLTIAVKRADGTTTTWTLTCEPPGGDHPDPAKACQVLAAEGASALQPVPEDQVCSQMFGGAQTARITGTWRGQPVTSDLSLTNGCEISRWSALEGLLPPVSEG